MYQTSRGYNVTILATGLDGTERKVSGIVHHPDGTNFLNWWSSLDDLVKITQLTDLKIDDKVMVMNYEDGEWRKRHFAGISENGAILVFCDGKTSFTTYATIKWNQWRLPTEDEL